jgi:hypothetical protein
MNSRILLFLICILGLISCSPDDTENLVAQNPILKIFHTDQGNIKKDAYAYIAHAGGSIDGHSYTNSLEAIHNSIAAGYKLIEIDMIETADGALVGAHDWRQYKKITGFSAANQTKTPLSFAEFQSQKIYGKYSPLAAKDIREIFTQNTDLILVTDKTNNFQLLLEEFPFNERMIVEIFSHENYFNAIKAGVKNPMLSVDDSDEDLRFVHENNVALISVHSDVLAKNTQEFAKLYGKGVVIFVFSSNEASFMHKYLHKSASAFYTDFWDINANLCNNKKCITY